MDTVVVNGVSRPMCSFPESVDGLTPSDVLIQEYLDNIDPVFNDGDDKSPLRQ